MAPVAAVQPGPTRADAQDDLAGVLPVLARCSEGT